ncbi:glycosyl hydrolase family 28-related protein [Leuconostoc mesenteroides]|uniref:glycosyl hydrolase family 28-related protein n=1 Tax=Leuconostoc mesenteroides TaxID=1245 RepID=UPI00248B93E9|nr:glycosyl hydrolase family 28-related protein [Leuconostoc mesenteroides]
MNYGQYKVVSLKTPSLINKGGDTQLKPRFQLQNGYDYANINDENSVISVRNDTSFLFDVKTTVTNGEFVLDFSNENIASLPSGLYKFQITTTIDSQVLKYPDVDFVPFTITEDGRVQPNGLVPQITLDSVVTKVNEDIDEKVNKYLATVAKGDKGNKGDKGDPGIDGKDGISPKSQYLSIVDYGADPTGVNDSTDAFKKSISDAQSSGRLAVYVPSGTYLISNTLRLVEVHLIGESMSRSKIKSTASIAFEVGMFATIDNIKLDISAAPDGAKGFQLGFYYLNQQGLTTYHSAHYVHINNVIIDDDKSHYSTVGIYARSDYSQTPNEIHGIWGNNISNVFMFDIGNGIILDSRDYGWINGNKFENILVVGFQTFGVSLQSTGDNPLGLQHNLFNGVEVEALPQTSVGAKAFSITAGEFNFFNGCTTWDDTGGRSDVQPLYFGTSVGYPNYWDIQSNNFVNGKLENFVYGDWRVISLNKIDVYNVYNNKRPLLYSNHLIEGNYNNSNKKNMIATDALNNYVTMPELSAISINGAGSVTNNIDNVSTYVDIVTSGTENVTLLHNIFDNVLNELLTKKLISYSIEFNEVDRSNTTVSQMIHIYKTDGSKVDLAPDVVFPEAMSENEYVYNGIKDFSSTDLTNVAYIQMETVFSAPNGREFKLRGIKAANVPVNHYISYVKENKGKSITKSMPNKPNSWADLGIYLPSGINFDDNLLDYKQVGSKYYVSTPVSV